MSIDVSTHAELKAAVESGLYSIVNIVSSFTFDTEVIETETSVIVTTLKNDITINGNGYDLTTGETLLGIFTIDSTVDSDVPGTGVFIINNISVVVTGILTNMSGIIQGNATVIAGAYNITVDKCTVSGEFMRIISGGIIGGLDATTYNANNTIVITNCYIIDGLINTNAGGIVSSYITATISNCFTTSTISGVASGGITGPHFIGTIHDCYSLGEIAGDYSGGICANSPDGSTIYNCYSNGNITTDIGAGGIIGGGVLGFVDGDEVDYSDGLVNAGSISFIKNCYSNGTIFHFGSSSISGSIFGAFPLATSTMENCFGTYAEKDVTDGTGPGLIGETFTFPVNSSGFGTGTWSGTDLLDSYNGNDNIWSALTSPPYLIVFELSPWIAHTLYTSIDGFIVTDDIVATVPCFVTGTYILTVNGEVRIENLNIGDEIQVSDGRNVKIKQIAKRKIYNVNKMNIPYKIEQDFFGNNSPSSDLYISGNHLIKPEGKLWICPSLVEGIKQVEIEGHYYNLMLENYNTDIIVANNVKCDSLHYINENIFYKLDNSLALSQHFKLDQMIFVDA